MADNLAPPRSRTGWAIVVAFCAYLALYVVYGTMAATVIWLGAKYDRSNAWRAAAVLLLYAPTPFAAFGGQIVACRFFRHANQQAIFYAFCTGAVILIATDLAAPGANVIRAVIEAALAVAGARAAVVYMS